LAADQTLLAQRFATRGATKFSDSSSWQLNARGLPQLKGCVAIFECRQQQQVFAGDHLILIGQVEGFYADGGMPLIFHNSQFVTDMAETALPRGLQGQLG
jgi:flavin reductase (DIM6/NTAB) family NADH-FMN oxidoreductase RutF